MKIRQNRILASAMAALLMAGVLAVTPPAMADQAPVLLGTTEQYAVLAGSTVTNTGPTNISGDAGANIGLAPGTAVTGQAQITLSNGVYHIADDAARKAKDDLITAYDDAAGRGPVTIIPTQLGNQTLLPGVYASADGTFNITGTLTLNAQGDPNAVFIFKTASTLITASSSVVSLIGGARYCRVFWQVGSSATLGTNSTFVGHIMAMESITATTGAFIQGQLMARIAAVTLDTNTIVNGFCPTIPTPTPVPGYTLAPGATLMPGVTFIPGTTLVPWGAVWGATQLPGYTLAPGVTLIPGVTFIPGTTIVPRGVIWVVPSATNLPPTGDTTTDRSAPGILAAGAGIILILAGISLYLFKRKKANT